jgi:hypothetical protein
MKKTILLLTAALLLTGCVTNPPNYVPTKTSLELQAIQSREFETPKRIAFAATMSVFQDFGYSISASDLDTGYISAKSPTQSKKGIGRYIMNDTKVTAFIEEMRPGITKVRINFIHTEEWKGLESSLIQDSPIEDPAVYNNAFIKIQEAIFIRSGTN